MSVTQLQYWVVFAAPDGASVARFFDAWTGLNVNHATPIMAMESLLKAASVQKAK
jgi:hypothetical protein